MAKPCLTLVLPGYSSLLNNAINRAAQPASLKKIIDRSHFTAQAESLDKMLFNCFYPALEQAKDLPMAALLSKQPAQLCVSPCHVYADQARLLLFHQDIELTDDESAQLIETLQPLFAEKQATLIAHNNQQWLLQLPQPPLIECTALLGLEGQSVLEHLPTGDEAADWITLWNEIQMLLFDLPLNQQREANRQLPVNSVWFWGAGQLPTVSKSWQQVIGQQPLLADLATLTDSPYQVSVVEADFLSDLNDEVLMVLPELNWQQDWQAQLREQEQILFKPLWNRLRRGRLAKLTLLIPDWGHYTITPLQSWKFW